MRKEDDVLPVVEHTSAESSVTEDVEIPSVPMSTDSIASIEKSLLKKDGS